MASGTAAFVGGFFLGGGDLPDSCITDGLTVSTRNRVVVTGSGNVTMTLTPGTGAFSGHFLYPVTKKNTSFGGVIYQKPPPAVGFGLFLGADQCGGVEISQ